MVTMVRGKGMAMDSNVSGYIQRLESAGTDRAVFDRVHAALGADKSVMKEDMDAIAHGYTGGRSKWPTRTAALEAVKIEYLERAYQEVKMVGVEKASRW